jgi:leucyl aminopeptidase
MQIKLQSEPLEQIAADALAAVVFEDNDVFSIDAPSVKTWLADLKASGEFSGKSGESAVLYNPAGLAAKRVIVVGVGKFEKFDFAALRKIVGSTVRTWKQKGIQTLAWSMKRAIAAAAPPAVEAAVEGAILGNHENDAHKTKKDSKSLQTFSIAAAPGLQLEKNAERGRILGEAQNFTRELANEPANRLTPLILADRARAMSQEYGLSCEVLDEDRMRQLGMGSLLGVAMGSSAPPALIIVRYIPEAAKTADHLGLVGKGVTFDTGGISIKPAEGMEKMKYDMSGGAAALGAMRAIAQLKPAIAVTAIIPAVENMINGKAQRPGDIVKSLDGKTIEVLNTDAEGRLILIDAITYAKRLGCTHLVDAATLTGAITVALGSVRIGAFTNSEAMMARVMAASNEEGEKMWQMPMDDEYRELLKSPFADLANIGGRAGGSISAAWFIKEFADPTPWVHLDIAGTAWLDDAKPHMAKGPSGVCVRTFVRLAESW